MNPSTAAAAAIVMHAIRVNPSTAAATIMMHAIPDHHLDAESLEDRATCQSLLLELMVVPQQAVSRRVLHLKQTTHS